MTADNSPNNLVDIPEDLASFKAIFDGKEVPKVEDTEDNALAPDEDTDASEEDDAEAQEDSEEKVAEDPDEDQEAEEAEAPKEKAPKQKSRYQVRIDELTKVAREAERREAATLQRLAALEAAAHKVDTPIQEPVKLTLPPGAPNPYATDSQGNPRYPLAEIDPLFIHELTKFTITAEMASNEQRKNEHVAAQQLAQAQDALKNQWAVKLDAAEEATPEIREHIGDLVGTFQNLQPAYGEYLATTIMQCENGPAILEYLSQNIGEAQNIVASGPAAATLAIGRLEAKLSPTDSRPNEEEKRNKNISQAPEPPAKLARGSGTKTSVRPDTMDLAAFKREFMSGKK